MLIKMIISCILLIDVDRKGIYMIYYNATEAKTHFGELLDKARHETVTIDKNGRPVVVVLSTEAYERYQDMEDHYWALKAQLAKSKGFLSKEESEKLLEDMLNA